MGTRPLHMVQLEQDSAAIEHRPPQRGFLAYEQLQKLEELLDRRFSLFGFRLGLDGLIGLIPGIGDIFGAGLSSVILADAWRKGARKRVLARMAANMAIDATLGSIPLVGDLFDFGFKANTKNVRLLLDEMEREYGLARRKPEAA